MNHNQSMLARLAAFVVWALVAASVVFWGLRLLVRSPAAPPHSMALIGTAAAQGDLTRLLGAAPVTPTTAAIAPDAASRYKLHGVMAPKGKADTAPSSQGVALISIDGKPPRAFAIGSRLERDLILQSVSLRTASIGPAQGGASVKLELPPLPLPATGKLAPISLPTPAHASIVPGAAGVPPSVITPGAAADAAMAGNVPTAAPPTATAPAPLAAPAAVPPVSRPPHGVAPRRESASSR